MSRSKSKVVDGVRFSCVEAGEWKSEDGRYVIYRMLQGTSFDSWEVYPASEGLKGAMVLNEWSLTLALKNLVSEYYKRK